MTRVVPVALDKSSTVWVPWWWRHRQAVMSEEKGIWRNARSIDTLSEVRAREGEVAATASEPAFTLHEGVVGSRDKGLDIGPGNGGKNNWHTRSIRNGNTDVDVALQDDGTNGVDAIDTLDDVRRRRRLLRSDSRRRISKKVPEDEVRAAALEQVVV